MILKVKDELDYEELCDYKLDTLLMTHIYQLCYLLKSND